ncbi:MAG: acyl-CoA dehydrogenase family protein, partial [Gammaproteobacteria bacterium]|nr:acyl-CoA dehydrogenase family protein [Gammaproteobacteria bacterium]
MNFEFSNDQLMLRDEAQKFLANKCPIEEVHRVLNGDDAYSKPVWEAVVDMGWTATAMPEEFGGFGMGYLELCVLAEEVGRALAPVPFSSSVYLAAECLLLVGSEPQKAEWLPKIASGEVVATLAVVDEGQNGTSGTTCKNGRLSGSKIVVPDAELADVVLVIADDGGSKSLFIAATSANGLVTSPQATIDPSRSYSKIE